MQLQQMIDKLQNINVLVIGDMMLDHYIIGEVNRISPEAPVPIINVCDENHNLGGAGNVIKNLASLGCKVHSFSVLGDDEYTPILFDLICKYSYKSTFEYISKINTRKLRAITNDGTQLLRIDYENISKLNYNLPNKDIFKDIDIIIISDYNKGVINLNLMNLIKSTNIPVIVDPKPENIKLYDDVFMITPNLKEFEEIKKEPLNTSYILKTLGSNGMELIDNINQKTIKINSNPIKVYNVSGAGDVVISTMGVCIAIGLTDYELSAKISNEAARYSVIKPGTSVINIVEFQNAIDKILNHRTDKCII